MVAYITITEPETDPGAPGTSELWKKWRDNAIAMNEADSTAPVNQTAWHPYNKVTNGDANTGRFYDFATDGSVSNVVTPDFVDGYEYRVRWIDIQPFATGNVLTVDAYRETSAAYAGAATIATSSIASGRTTGELVIMNPRSVLTAHLVSFGIGQNTSGNDVFRGIASGAITVHHATAQKILRLRLAGSSNISAGQMYLDRRRAIY